jgi:RHS repeat-associated protein
VTSGYQQTDSQNYGFGYGYNLASEMTAETYPSGRQVITEYDSAGRAAGIRSAAIFYAGARASDATNRIQYTAHGAVSVMKFDNDLWEHTNFNSRLQPTQIGLGTSRTDSSFLKLDYEYTSSCQTGNNGNVLKQTINASGLILTQTYCYDALNRLSSASENSGASWSQTYGFDRYGNRWVNGYIVPGNESRTPTSQSAFNQSNNQIQLSGFSYDAAGNLKNDPTTVVNAMLYDAENRQVSYAKNGTTTYSYDGDGHRVKKVAGSVTTVFVYNASGQLTAEYTNDTTPPVGGGGTSYLTSDHLGSTRVVMKDDGTTVKARYDYLPFGEEIPSTIGSRGGVAGYGGADSTKQKFTQKERDSESGLDYFLARYYSSAQGRFTSTDPEIIPKDISNPQAWNKYPYTFNNPLRYVDPDGQAPQDSFDNRINHRIQQLLKGEITEQQYREALRGESVGAIAGLGVVGAIALGIQSPQIVQGIFLWAARNPDKIQQIAAALQEAGGGPPGAITGTVGSASRAELSIAQKLAAEGKNVEVLAAKGVGRTADFVVNGIKTELKTLEGVGGAATSGTVKNAIGRALGQSGNVIIDASAVKLTSGEAQKGAARAFGADSRLQTVRIIGKGFDITIARQQ